MTSILLACILSLTRVYVSTNTLKDIEKLMNVSEKDSNDFISSTTSPKRQGLLHKKIASSKHRDRRSIEINGDPKKFSSNDVHELRLVNDLFRNYTKEQRPVAKYSDAVQVVFGIAYTQLIDLDEKKQVLISNVWVRTSWINHLLTWNKEDYGGIESINIEPNTIWLPDIVLYNNAEEGLGSGQMDQFKTKVIISNDGTNRWYAPTILRSHCGINVEYFPFDDQKCRLTFLSWAYDGFQVNITNKSPAADTISYTPSGEFNLLSAKANLKLVKYPCCSAPYPQVTYTIHISRKTLFYFNNLIVPCFFITALSLLTFVLPPATGERVTLVITTLLAMTVFMLMIAEKTPTTSTSTPLICKFFIASIGTIGLSLIATCIVLNLYECKRPMESVPPLLRIFMLEYLSPLMRVAPPRVQSVPSPPTFFSPQNDVEEEEGEEEEENDEGEEDENNTWNFHKTYSFLRSGSTKIRRRCAAVLPKKLLQGIAILATRARQQDEQLVNNEEWKLVAKIADRIFLIIFCCILAVTKINLIG